MKVIEALPDSCFIRRVRNATTGYRIRTKKVHGTKLRTDKRYGAKMDLRFVGRG